MQPCFKTMYIGLKALTVTQYTAKRRSFYFRMIESKNHVGTRTPCRTKKVRCGFRLGSRHNMLRLENLCGLYITTDLPSSGSDYPIWFTLHYKIMG